MTAASSSGHQIFLRLELTPFEKELVSPSAHMFVHPTKRAMWRQNKDLKLQDIDLTGF